MFNQFKLLGAATLALALMPNLAYSQADISILSSVLISSDSNPNGWSYDLTTNAVTNRNPKAQSRNNPNRNALYLNITIDDTHRINIKHPVLFKNNHNNPIDVTVNLTLPNNQIVPLSISKEGIVKEVYLDEHIKEGEYFIGFNDYGNNKILGKLNRNFEMSWNNDHTKLTLKNVYLENVESIKNFEQQYIVKKDELDSYILKNTLLTLGIATTLFTGGAYFLSKKSTGNNKKNIYT